MPESYIHPTQESGRAFMSRRLEGEVVMLNLLKFREIADYSDSPHLDPGIPISGQEAYDRYIEHTLPFLDEIGSELIFSGQGGHFVIGPQDESWDLVLLVKHPSVAKFMSFAGNEGYLKIAGHRTAALQDSRLLPIVAG